MYVGIMREKDFVEDVFAYEYALNRIAESEEEKKKFLKNFYFNELSYDEALADLESSIDTQKEFVDYYYSGNWIHEDDNKINDQPEIYIGWPYEEERLCQII